MLAACTRARRTHPRGSRTRIAISVALVLSIALSALAPAGASAQTAATNGNDSRINEARELFARGLTFVDQERWGEALEYFRRSRALAERPSTLFNIAVALYRLSRSREAVAAFDDFIRVADPIDNAGQITEARRFMAVLAASIGTLALTVSPEHAVVRVDDEPTPAVGRERIIVLDPGAHRISVEAAGFLPTRFEESVLAGERASRDVTLVAIPATLVVSSNVADAEVAIDGQVVLIASPREVPPGRHVVTVSARGYERFEREIVVRNGEQARISANLAAERSHSVFASPVFWILAGAVVVGTVATIAIATSGGEPSPTYNGTTGVQIQGLQCAF